MAAEYALRLDLGAADPAQVSPALLSLFDQLKSLAKPDAGSAFLKVLYAHLAGEGGGLELDPENFAGFPTFRWQRPEPDHPSQIVVRISLESPAIADWLRNQLPRLEQFAKGFGIDPRIHAFDTWAPFAGTAAIFGDRARADRLIGAAALRAAGATGQGVNVVIVDRGIESGWVRDARRRAGGSQPSDDRVLGWPRFDFSRRDGAGLPIIRQPGTHASAHGHMIARNILALAPDARLFDVALIPELDAPPALSEASVVFHAINLAVAEKVVLDTHGREPVKVAVRGQCVVVNAWGVLDSAERGADYADNPNHFVVNDMATMDKTGIDMVFAAGNCGEPCPDPRCGETDRGPGRSASGLNAHPAVLSVGAVRADGVPVRLSAQGPGRLHARWLAASMPEAERAREKPDLCAPSHFRETDDALVFNTGTSAACAMAAGVIAALRSLPGLPRAISPAEMRRALRESATGTGGTWHPRLGYGVINVPRAIDAVRRLAAADPA
jgi:subtilisin family serine protease